MKLLPLPHFPNMVFDFKSITKVKISDRGNYITIYQGEVQSTSVELRSIQIVADVFQEIVKFINDQTRNIG